MSVYPIDSKGIQIVPGDLIVGVYGSDYQGHVARVCYLVGTLMVSARIERKKDGVLLAPHERTQTTATGKEWTVLR